MSSDFEFSEDGLVLIRVRENKTSGPLRAKLVAECTGIRGEDRMTATQAQFEFPVGTINNISMAPYGAEFEVVDDVNEVTF